MNREEQSRPSRWDFQKRFSETFKAKTCLHPQADAATCRGGIVRAHTVRKSADLKAIARKSHVYQGCADFSLLDRTGGRIVPRLIGINEASTFLGFCHAHDSSTFAPLETQAFGPTDEQAFLLAYRPLVKELYLKNRQLETAHLGREADKGRPLYTQFSIQEFLRLHRTGVESAIFDLEHHKALFDADLLARDFNRIRYVAIHLDRVPDLMCSGETQPAYTFDGIKIQDLADVESVLQQMSFTLLANGSEGAAVFSWHAESDPTSSVLVNSLLALPESDIPAALVRFALTEFENVFLRPEWWESLPRTTQHTLENHINQNVGPFAEVDPRCLCENGVRPVNWTVTRIEQRRSA
jgi:hypothetical protein